jgi:hypothetical protein
MLALLAGDLDHDGKPDLVSVSADSLATASVLLNDTPSGPFTYCTAGVTSHGCVPHISAAGTPSLSAGSGFTLSVTNVEGAKQGVVFLGVQGSTALPWAAGSSSYLCVRQPTQRVVTLNSGGTANTCNGAFVCDLNAFFLASPIVTGVYLQPGQTVDAQAWFRDPPAPKGTNLSGGLEFVLGS